MLTVMAARDKAEVGCEKEAINGVRFGLGPASEICWRSIGLAAPSDLPESHTVPEVQTARNPRETERPVRPFATVGDGQTGSARAYVWLLWKTSMMSNLQG